MKYTNEMKNEIARRQAEESALGYAGYHGSANTFKTQIYVPVSFADEKIKEYEELVKTKNLKLPATISREEAIESIKEDINQFWSHSYGVAEYSLYTNSITGEKRKAKNRRR